MTAKRRGERRRNRESFTGTLERLCARLDEAGPQQVQWTDRFFRKRHRARVRVVALWVAGSYARGSPECGDLDLIIEAVAEEGHLPPASAVARATCGNPPDVSYYLGNPEENSSGVAFPEAKLIWSEQQRGWQDAIASIPTDAEAGRFERESDVLPFRLAQLAVDLERVERLIEQRDQRVVTWEFVPADERSVDDLGTLTGDEQDIIEYVGNWCGKKTQQLLPHLVAMLRRRDPYGTWSSEWNASTEFRRGAAEVHVGRPAVRTSRLHDLACAELVIAPHLSRRGPNGAWIIGRGAAHPVRRPCAGKTAHYVCRDGRPLIVPTPRDRCKANKLFLYPTADEARETADELRAACDGEFTCREAAGADLLVLLARPDIVEIRERQYPISFDGRRVIGRDDLATPEEVLAALTSP